MSQSNVVSSDCISGSINSLFRVNIRQIHMFVYQNLLMVEQNELFTSCDACETSGCKSKQCELKNINISCDSISFLKKLWFLKN